MLLSLRLSSRIHRTLINAQAWDHIQRVRQVTVQCSAGGVDGLPQSRLNSPGALRTHGGFPPEQAQIQEVLQPPGGREMYLPSSLIESEQDGTGPRSYRTWVFDAVKILEKRLPELEVAVQELAAVVGSLTAGPNVSSSELFFWPHLRGTTQHLAQRLRVILETLRSSWSLAGNGLSDTLPRVFHLLSNNEWNAMIISCFYIKDGEGGRTVLELMKRVGITPSDEQNDKVLECFAVRGWINETDSFAAELTSDVPREKHRHLLVKARIKARHFHGACALLHKFEKSMLPAPKETYKMVISAFQREPVSLETREQLWDLFMHMCDVMNYTPDSSLYNSMICNAPSLHLALDLFEEMTDEYNMTPTTFTYNALIRRCAHSPESIPHMFRIARHMLDAHNEGSALLSPAFRDSLACFLMQNAAVIGDLSNGRWVVSKMSSGISGKAWNFVLAKMFHIYSAFRPQPSEKPAESPLSQSPDTQAIDLPQSSQEVLREATRLWQDIVKQIGMPFIRPLTQPLTPVLLTPRLINEYLKVHYAHSPPSESHEVFVDIFESVRVRPDAYTYVLALEAYATDHRLLHNEQSLALAAARELWRGWLSLDTSVISQWHSEKEARRLISRAWGAMIRHVTIGGSLDEAEDLLRDFVRRYPPEGHAPEVPPERAHRERVVPDTRVAPFFTFRDLALLFDYAVKAQRTSLVKFVTWVSNAYRADARASKSTYSYVRDTHYEP